MRRLLTPLLVLTAALAACADTQAAPNPSPGHRRVLVPAGRPEVWPRTGQAWVPIEKAEAIRLLRLADQSAVLGADLIASRLTIQGRLDESTLVGKGELRVELNGRRDAFLPWPAGGTRVSSPHWDDGEESPALLGDWGGDAGAGRGLLVDREGVMRFTMRCEATGSTETRAEYRLGLPSATTTTLLLQLPPLVTPSIDRGVVSPQPVISPSTDEPNESPPASWRIVIPPGGPARLAITKPSPASAAAAEFRATQDLRYVISESGVETRCRFRLQATGRLPGAVRAALPPNTHLTHASQDGQPVTWSLSEAEPGEVVARVTLNDDAPDSLLELTLISADVGPAPITLPLPKLANAQWLEGAAAVRVAAPLRLQDITQLTFAQPVDATPQDAGDAADLALRLSRPDAVIRLQVGARGPLPKATVSRTVTLGIDRQRNFLQAQSEVTIALDASGGAGPRRLRFPLPGGWAINAVNASPSGVLEGWRLAYHDGGSRLDLSLAPASSASPHQPTLQLSLARRGASADARTPLAELLAVRLTGVSVISDRLRIVAAAPYHLRLFSAPEPTAVADDETTSVQYDAEQEPLAQRLASGEVMLVREPMRRVTQCVVRVSHEEGLWRYAAELTVPPGARSDAALARFEPPLPESAVLSVGGQERGRSALLVPPRDDSLPTPVGLVALPLDDDNTTNFRITFDSQDQAPLDIPMPSLEDAAEQRGRLILAGAAGGTAGLRSNGLTPIAAPADADAGREELWFRYDPTRVGAQDLSALLTRQSDTALDPPLDLRSVETRILVGGRLVHHLEYRAASSTRPAALRLPGDAALLSASDQAGLAVTQDQDAPDRVVLTVAPAPKPRTVRLSVEWPQQTWSVESTLPLEGIASLGDGDWTWRLVTPSSYELSSPQQAIVPGFGRPQSRLLGPVDSVLKSGGYNPFVRSTWWPFKAPEPEGTARLANGGRAPLGWRCYSFNRVGSAPPDLRVVQHDQVLGGAATLGVLLACVSSWWWPRATQFLVTVALTAAVLALLLPADAAVWGAATWIGLAAGAMLSPLSRSAVQWLPNLRGPRPGVAPAAPTMTAMVLLALAGAAGAQPPAELPSAEQPLQTVLIPIDDQQRPIGDKWYLGGDFLNQLHRLANQRRSAAPAGWVLQSVRVNGALRAQPGGAGVTSEPWTVLIDLWTDSRDTKVELPLRRDDAQWSDKAIVDGIATPLAWSESGDACQIMIAEPGRRRVSLTLTPKTASADAEGVCLRLALPACSQSTLTLAAPEGLPGLRANSLELRSINSGTNGQLQADLSGKRELQLCWGAGRPDATVSPRVCDQLQWLRLSPAGATLAVQCALEGASPLPESLTVALPPLLQRSGADDAPRELSLRPVVAWGPELTSLTYAAELELPRESGYGLVPTPALPPHGVTLRSRLAAVSAESRIAINAPVAPGLAPFDAEEFSQRWSWGAGQPAVPDRAVLAVDPLVVWQVQSDARPQPAALSDQRLRLVLGRRVSTARLTVGVPAACWNSGKIDITVPASFELIASRLEAGGEATEPTVTRPESTRLAVFAPASDPASAGAASNAVLDLYGVIQTPAATPADLPVARVANRDADPLRVDLWRLPDSLVTLSGAGRELLMADTLSASAADNETPVGSLRLLGQQPPPQISVTANEPRYRVDQVTAHQRTADGVEHGILARVQVLQGQLAELAVDLPEQSVPLALTAPSGAIMERATGGSPGRQRVRLGSVLSAGEQVELRIESQQPVAPGTHPAQLVAFPDAVENEALVALHAGPYISSGRWLTNELVPSTGQHNAPTAAFAGPGWTLYQAAAPEQASVSWARRDKRPPECLVRLQESSFAADPRGRTVVATRLILDPNGAGACRLLLGAGSRLTSIEVNGRLPIATRESERVWRVTLLSEQQPQAVTAIAVVDEPSERQVVVPPHLISGQGAPLRPVEMMVALQEGPAARLSVAADLQPIDSGRVASARLAAMTFGAGRAGGTRSPWWLSRLQDQREAVGQGPGDAEADAGFAYAPDDHRDYFPTPAAGDSWRWVQLTDPTANAAITVDAGRPSGLGSRVAMALLIVAAAVGYHVGCRQPEVAAFVRARHNTAIALAGLLWWLCLPLGACGLLLMTAAALAEARTRRLRIISRG